jgi:uncharacterized protein (DUF362 family)
VAVMTDPFDRRRFLKRLGAACAGIAGAAGLGLAAHDRGRDEPRATRRTHQVRDYRSDLEIGADRLVVAGGSPADATRAAIERLGGMGRFVRAGERVVLKPNIGWDRTPLQAANTNPLVVATLVELCLAAGAAEVIVTDNTCNEARRCFTRSGIWKTAEQAGATIVLPAPHRFRPYELGGVILGRMPVLAAAVQADRLINVPVAKHHGLSGFTGAMKNRLHQRIDESIADLADFIRPTLTVLDATRVLKRNGPVGGDVGDTEAVGKVLASVDQVAVDAYACRFIDLAPGDLPYLALGGERGLGTPDLSRIQVEEIA